MASLKCSHCGFGIHNHGYANGIEYEAYPLDLWNEYSNVDKPILEYAPLGDEDYLTVWRCPDCGCIHLFNGNDAFLRQAYVPCDIQSDLTGARQYLVFIDYLRDKVFDAKWTAAQFMQSGKYPNDQFFYAIVGDAGVIVYEDADCSTPLRRYKAIETIIEG